MPLSSAAAALPVALAARGLAVLWLAVQGEGTTLQGEGDASRGGARVLQTQTLGDPLAPEDQQSCTRDASDPKLARFCVWLEERCRVEGLANIFLAGFDHGGARVRGLGAARDIEKGEEVICVPRACWFVSGSESERVKRLAQGCPADQVLALHIAEERSKGEDSLWAPFLDMLPDEAVLSKFHPAYLLEEGNSNSSQVGKYANYWPRWSYGMMTCYNRYKGAAQGAAVVPGDAAFLAHVQLLSRRFGAVDMPPLLDFVNTAPEARLTAGIRYAKDRKADDEAVCLNSLRDLRKGEELLVDYGAEYHSAMLLFAIYGFALAPEVHDPLGHDWPGVHGTEVDACEGLRDLEEPDPSRQPVLHNFWRFAQVHCRERPEEEPSGSAAPEVDGREAPATGEPEVGASEEPRPLRRTIGGCLVAAGVVVLLLSVASLALGRAGEKRD